MDNEEIMTMGEATTTWVDFGSGSQINPATSGTVTIGTSGTYAYSGANWEITGALPEELKVCQVCGIEDVVVFCDECKNIMNWARKKWAEAAMRELEDDLS